MSPAVTYIGLFLRTLLVYIGIFGITSFICGAAGLTAAADWRSLYVSTGFIALVSLAPALACGLASVNRIFAAAVPFVYTGIYMGVVAYSYGNPVEFTVQSAVRVYNFALYHVVSYGYYSLGNYMVSDGYDYSSAAYAVSDPQRFCGVFLLCTLVGLILYFTVQRKVRIIPLALFSAAVIAPVLTYNLPYGNAGTAFFIVFICGAVALKVYDRRYCGNLENRAAKKAERLRRKAEKREKRRTEREEKTALRERAALMYHTALEAGMDKKAARAARRAVYIEKRKKEADERRAEKALRLSEKLAEKNRRAAKKAEKKNIRQLKKSGKKQEAAKAAHKLRANAKKERKAAKIQKLTEKKALRLRRRRDRKEARRASFAGGYAGMGAALIALIAVLIPLLSVNSNFRTIPAIDNRVNAARIYVTAYLRGDDVDLNELYAYGIDELTPRTVSFEPLEYKDTRTIFQVESDQTDNIYLRSWTGSDFDWEGGTWSSADYDTVLSYRETFGRDFTPDSISTAFYKYVYPSVSEKTDGETREFYNYGFSEQHVSVWRVSGSSRLLFVPSHMNTDYMLMRYGTLDDAQYKYSVYYDGVYSSRFYKYGSGYSTVSFVPAMGRKNALDNMGASAEYYSRCCDFILENLETDKGELPSLIAEFEKKLSDDGISHMGTSLCERYFGYMTETEQKQFLSDVEKEKAYRAYAYDACTDRSGSAAVEEIAVKIAEGFDQTASTVKKVKAVADYLADNYTYTKEPDASLYDGTKPVIDAFLTDVKEGYCSHFATAACALLREYGIPVRYAEGYVASDFEKAAGGKTADYRAYVNSECAHAWIEVYIDGMGWLQFEVTPGEYSDAMYRASGATIDITPEEQEKDENSKENEKEDGESSEKPHIPSVVPDGGDGGEAAAAEKFAAELAMFIRAVCIALAVCLAAFLIRLLVKHIIRKAAAASEKKFGVINCARRREMYEKEDFDQRGAVRKMHDWIADILSLLGAAPEKGELASDYAERLRRDLTGLSNIDAGDVILLLQKEEFGHGLSFEEAQQCAEFCSDLITEGYKRLPLARRLTARYISHRI